MYGMTNHKNKGSTNEKIRFSLYNTKIGISKNCSYQSLKIHKLSSLNSVVSLDICHTSVQIFTFSIVSHIFLIKTLFQFVLKFALSFHPKKMLYFICYTTLEKIHARCQSGALGQVKWVHIFCPLKEKRYQICRFLVEEAKR